MAPFPYGAVLPNGTLILEICAFTIAILALTTRPADQRPGAGVIPAIALAGIAVIGVIQLIPMSVEQLRTVSPASARVYAEANEILRLFHQSPVTARISIAPTDTVNAMLLTLAYCAALIASMILVNTRFRRRVLLATLLSTAIVHIIVASLSSDASDRLHGTFVDADHMAGYLEIALAFAFALVWGEVLTSAERGRKIRDRGERVERRVIALGWRILLWAIIATGIVLTRSRGGLLAAVASTCALLLMALLQLRGSAERRHVPAVIAVAFSAGILFIVLTTGRAAVLRFLASDPRDIGTDTRVEIWRGSVRAWQMFPNAGSGLGSFREAYRRVQPAEVVGMVEQAHNDFLQLLVTGGWAAAALGAFAFGSMFILLFVGWMAQQHRAESAFILGGFGALLCLTLHGFVEFNMSIPAIPATLAVMLGAAWSAAQTT